MGSENYKTERKMNRFQKWRRRLSGAKKEGNKNKEDTSIEVTQRTSKHDRFFTGTAKKITSENETNREQVTGIEQENLTA